MTPTLVILTVYSLDQTASVPTPTHFQARPLPSARQPLPQAGVRVYKPKTRGRRHHANLSLVINKTNTCVSFQLSHIITQLSFRSRAPKKVKSDKQCPFFSRTGTLVIRVQVSHSNIHSHTSRRVQPWQILSLSTRSRKGCNLSQIPCRRLSTNRRNLPVIPPTYT